jgi:PHD/YefM family antitoxin component YafN of YafNO toxin-antitoxin module
MERETTQDEVKHTNPRYLTDEKGKRVGVILGVEEYEALIEELEDIRDAKEVQAAIRRGEEDVLPWEQAKKEIEAERAELRRRGEL